MRSIGKTIVIATVIAGCGDDRPPGEQEERSALIQGVPGWEQLSGRANVGWTEGTTGFSATIEMQGDEPGQVRPWHVHFGTCEIGGAFVGSDEHYSRLIVEADGTAFASDFVPAPLTVGERYHVNVHLSEQAMETIIACGDLEAEPVEI